MGIALVVTLLVISLGIHEAAHAWVALKCGDSTARDLGRITLNPIPHIDPVMTVILPTLVYYSTGFFFGGAKPVPVLFHRLRHPYRDMALVAIAGPLSNFLLAIFFLFLKQVLVVKAQVWEPGTVGDLVLEHAVFWNLVLAAFNLIPIPPLDGSRVLTWLLPQELREPYNRLGSLGIFLVMALVLFVQPVQAVLWQAIQQMYDAVRAIVTLGGVW